MAKLILGDCSLDIWLQLKKIIWESVMPIYEYECECCGQCFEQLVFAADENKVNCPNTG
jgi:hypothetical protein